MSGNELIDIINAFFQDARLYMILSLIGLDLALGVAAAIKAGAFDWQKLAQFYRTMVAPYVLGYLALYVAFGMLPGGLEGLMGNGLATTAFGAVVANLLGSVWGHLAGLGIKALDADAGMNKNRLLAIISLLAMMVGILGGSEGIRPATADSPISPPATPMATVATLTAMATDWPPRPTSTPEEDMGDWRMYLPIMLVESGEYLMWFPVIFDD